MNTHGKNIILFLLTLFPQNWLRRIREKLKNKKKIISAPLIKSLFNTEFPCYELQ